MRIALTIIVLLILALPGRTDGIMGNAYVGADGIYAGKAVGGGGQGINNGGKFTGVAPVNCGVGAIDFSTGCVQPMFGVL